MAASGKNLSILVLGLIFRVLVLIILPHATLCQNNTTTAPTTGQITPTAPVPATTVLLPTKPPTEVPVNTDISKCPCDLTGNVCNINCCCDPDCTPEDIVVFQCLPNSVVNTIDNKQCFSKNVFLFENGPATSQESDDGLFCIYFDNDESHNFYTIPSEITTEKKLMEYTKMYGKFSFQSTAAPTLTADFKDYYVNGDVMYTVFPDQSVSYLGLPSAISTTPQCVDGDPAGYLVDKTSQCLRVFTTDIEAVCTTDKTLSASTFYDGFRIVMDPYVLKAFNSTSVTIDEFGRYPLVNATDLYNNSYTIALIVDKVECFSSGLTCNTFNPPPDPTNNAQNCSNVLTQVHYEIITNGTYGILTVNVSFVLSDVDNKASSLLQTYSVSFNPVNGNGIARSGNPGYVVDKPIIAGIMNATQPFVEKVKPLSLVRPSPNQFCDTNVTLDRVPVLFGQDMRTGCLLNVAGNPSCQLLQEQILRALEGFPATITNEQITEYTRSNLYLATFGNSEPQETGDWVRVLYRDRPTPPLVFVRLLVSTDLQSTDHCRLSLGMNIQILYANVGSLANPQPKIIGAAFVYDQLQEVKYLCAGPFCQPGSTLTENLEISSSVTFIDVSQLPENVEGLYPTFAIQLPYDFFYPFLSSNSCPIIINTFSLLSCVLSALVGNLL